MADTVHPAFVAGHDASQWLIFVGATTTTPLGQLASTVCRPVSRNGQRYRGLRPFSPEDRQLLEAISDGAHVPDGTGISLAAGLTFLMAV